MPILGAAAALLALPSSAIVATPHPPLCVAFSKADLVVTGTASAYSVDDEWQGWTVTVDRFYKGRAPQRLRVVTQNTSARGWAEAGKRNLLFIERKGGRFQIWGSDPNSSGAAMAPIEAEVKALAAKPVKGPGSISLYVASEQGGAMPGVRVRLRHAGGERERIVRTDKAGRASLRAAPGRWTAEVTEPGWTSRFSLYTYQRADGFELAPGGCADLRLEPIRLGSGGKT
ncbi:carboxypeptidase regulatory-like domain-containing protein [Sphingopyxis sp. OPL5]|uniref:carboxypeptidase-like regulatory domain-containing protein n=1 Tax=Sphingopyxis sp. OPL5 TaxID=2486273 RepID=UPI00164DB531|nr:carboxypeptidase-like regulatory domain-containing protein [Sphingopyxis sp. OPL5]QNO25453.1 carboxypeptidase regulatory-like domain-containing protein [Sphingopyxis sp. OPL5]